MIEVEIKLPLEKDAHIADRLVSLGFRKTAMLHEQDIYFDNAQSQIKNNGQALRVREITDLTSNRSEAVITFKGKKLDHHTMSRKELEAGVTDASTCIEILEELGFHSELPIVRKKRHEYIRGRVTACVDTVEGLGDFLELEIMAREQKDKPAALEQIQEILKILGYSLADTVQRSYLGMLQLRGMKNPL